MELLVPPVINSEKVSIIMYVDITILQSDVNRAFDEATSAIKRKSVIPGFRKGKAPLKCVYNFKHSEVTADATLLLKNAGIKFFTDSIDKSLKPFLEPCIENDNSTIAKKDHSFSFRFSYQVDPQSIIDNLPGADFNSACNVKNDLHSYSQSNFGPASTQAISQIMYNQAQTANV